MNQNPSQMPVVQTQPQLPTVMGPPPDAEQNPLLLVHNLLRGRYIIAIALGAVLGAIGLAGGYLFITEEYESVALVRVAPVLPRVLYENEHNAALPMFDSFLQTQVALINSRRVVEMAMQSPDWRAVGGEFSMEALADFQEGLNAGTAGRGSQLIQIAFRHEDPVVARTAVKSVADAYLSIYGETDLVSDTQRLRILEERERTLANELEQLSARILDIANEYGTSTLDTIYGLKVEELHNLGVELQASRLEVAMMEARLSGELELPDDALAPTEELTVDQIAGMDGRMLRMVEDRRQIEMQLEDYAMTYRAPEQFPEYRRYQRRLEAQDTEIEQYAARFRETYTPPAAVSFGDMPTVRPTDSDIALMRQRITQLEERQREAQEQTQTIGRRNVQIERLRAERSRAQEALNTTRFRIESLSLESTVGGRISLMTEPEVPSAPANANRRFQMAFLGGMAGGGVGVGLIMLLGLFNPRVRDTVDAERGRPSLLGALPELPEHLTDPSEALIAAQCVHHIRTMLQSRTVSKRDSVLAVTSSSSGSGKTSLVLSLGMSFALAGSRTLLIDGDPMGMGLSRRTGAVAKQKLGMLLCEYGIISPKEAKKAIDQAQRSGARIGQVLLELGYVSDADLSEALKIQSHLRFGLADALNGRPIQDCIADIGVRNLSVLPAGDSAASLINGLAPDAVAPLIERLRNAYDTILIDTGPVPGTTDSSVMAATADGVILVVSRGDLHTNVQRTVQHLQRVNAPLTGLVMNRAKTRDIERSGHSSSVSSTTDAKVAAARKENMTTPETQTYAALGPLPYALISMSAEAAANGSPDASRELANKS